MTDPYIAVISQLFDTANRDLERNERAGIRHYRQPLTLSRQADPLRLPNPLAMSRDNGQTQSLLCHIPMRCIDAIGLRQRIG